jgi:hypothetical protein
VTEPTRLVNGARDDVEADDRELSQSTAVGAASNQDVHDRAILSLRRASLTPAIERCV